jgi:predicted alpha/beta-fold hydrolase
MGPGLYRAPAWLPGGHAQTIAAALAPRPHVRYRREVWPSPDGDRIAVDFAGPEPPAPDAAVLVLFHGLEGSSRSHYARWLMREAAARGYRACVAHFRGCGGHPNLLPRAYHSGDVDEIEWILRAVAARWPAARRYAMGVSLGGNALSKWLGERAGVGPPLQAAAVLSVPFDLTAAGLSLARGFNAAVYGRHFLRSMRPKALSFARRHPGLVDLARIRASRTLREFDDAFTAPLHGFRDVMHYWESASALPWLGRVGTPLLALNARNDPFVPAASLPRAADVSGLVLLEQTAQGGHAGFLQGRWPGDGSFVPRRVMEFFETGG